MKENGKRTQICCLLAFFIGVVFISIRTNNSNIELVNDDLVPEGVALVSLSDEGKNVSVSPVFEIKDTNFISAEENKFIDSNGSEFVIKGMGIENTWADNNNYTVDVEGIAEVKKLGFNTIHVWLRYDDFVTKDGNFKGLGWDYLRNTISCAKENELRVILKMENWPGYKISRAEIWNNKDYQEGLIKFWEHVSMQYKEEDTIIGFSCINEPSLLQKENAIKIYNEFIEELIKRIRKIDENHIIFIEKVTSNYDKKNIFKFPMANNIAYEFHMYEPINFTHQPSIYGPLISMYPSEGFYPNENQVFLVGPQTFVYNCDENYSNSETPMNYNFKSGGWQKLHYGYLDTSNVKAVTWSMRGDYLGDKTTLLVDDVIFKTYDKDKKELRTIVFNFDNKIVPYAGGWENPKAQYSSSDGYSKPGCITMSKTEGIISLTADKANQYFRIYQGECYASISAMVNFECITPQTAGYLNLTGIICDSVYVLNKEYLEYSIMQSMKYAQENRVPCYMGEVGSIFTSFLNNRGGDRYITDILDIAKNKNLSFNYHCYWNSAFGLYYINVRKDEVPNLKKVFEEKLN